MRLGGVPIMNADDRSGVATASAGAPERIDRTTGFDEFYAGCHDDMAVGLQGMVAAMLAGPLPEGADWATVRSSIESALADPSVLEGNLPDDSPLGPMPRHQALGIAIGDLLIHTWDVSRAIGADESLPPAAVEATSMGLRRMPAEFMRAPGRFADEVEVGGGAGAQDQLIAFSGRRP